MSGYSDDGSLFPNACKLAGVCHDSIPWDEFKAECLSGKKQCDKSQRVMIDLLDNILGELKSLDVERK